MFGPFTIEDLCHCEAVFAEAIPCFGNISTQKGIVTPPKNKCGGSQ